jgi:hypothetical protein
MFFQTKDCISISSNYKNLLCTSNDKITLNNFFFLKKKIYLITKKEKQKKAERGVGARIIPYTFGGR